ncbi:hypothetical protein EDD21DRAFT_372342 [Dissophora ornata]|nr:hypothetical protein BGZ58_004201 [Dissophora ornata]KAI8602285.1 hypothetical protein EDD21DRAFT_372342 [Dissophora ornata]
MPPHNFKQTVRAGEPSRGSYAPDSLMTEQEMALELESDSNQKMNPFKSTWPPVPMLHSLAYRGPPPAETTNIWVGIKNSGSTLQKSTSNHTVYVPPPLPPITLTSSIKVGATSPYADDAMIVFPPDSPPPVIAAASKASGDNLSVVESQNPTTDDCETDDDEPSMLQLDNTLSIDRYTKGNSSITNDRGSISSFFSTLATDPEPALLNHPTMPPLPEPPFASEEFIMPAPVARIVPALSAATTRTAPQSSSSSTSSSSATGNQISAYDRKREEVKVATCFAQDLGFEIVNPSPMTSPRQGASHSMG